MTYTKGRETITTKEKILAVAVELFAKNGYSNTSMREIASLVGIQESVIYRHYTSKSEILDEVIDRYERTYRDFFMTREQIDALIDICTPKQFLDTFVKFHSRNEQEFMSSALRILFREEDANPEMRKLVDVDLFHYFDVKFKYVLDELVKRGGLPKLDTASLSLLWAQVAMSITYRWATSYPDRAASKQVAEEYTSLSYLMIELALTGQVPLEQARHVERMKTHEP